jgi:hypothetical protein
LSPRRTVFVLALLQGLWIYLLVLWGYIVIDTFVFPQYQFLGISEYIPIPQNVLADLAFPLSFVCFVLWRYLERLAGEKRLGG